MAGFAGMDEHRGRAGGGERRRDLVGDMAAFAHAGHDGAAGEREQQLHGQREAAVQLVRQNAERVASCRSTRRAVASTVLEGIASWFICACGVPRFKRFMAVVFGDMAGR